MNTNEQRDIDLRNTELPQVAVESASSVSISRRNFTKSSLAVSGVLLTLASRSAVGGDLVCKSPSGFLSGNTSVHGTPTTCSGRSPGYWGTRPDQWPMPYEPGKCVNNCQSSQGSDSSSNSSSKESSSNSSSKDSSSNSSSKDSSSGSSGSSGSNSSSQPSAWNSCTKASDWEEGTRFCSVFDCYGNGSIYSQYSMMQVLWLNGNQDPYQLGAHFVSAILNTRMGVTPILSDTEIVNIFNEWNRKGFFEPTAGVKWYAPDIVAYFQSTLS